MKIKNIFDLILFIIIISISVHAQVRDSRIHEIGMLHETVYNDGSIGRAYMDVDGKHKLTGWYQFWADQSIPFGRCGPD